VGTWQREINTADIYGAIGVAVGSTFSYTGASGKKDGADGLARSSSKAGGANERF